MENGGCRCRAHSRPCCFFFQAEDGIRDVAVTGVQTCALPIYDADDANARVRLDRQKLRQRHAVEPLDLLSELFERVAGDVEAYRGLLAREQIDRKSVV